MQCPLCCYFLGKPNKKAETKPSAPKKCDPVFSFDAAAVIKNEIIFFENRYKVKHCKQLLKSIRNAVKLKMFFFRNMWMRTTKSTYWNRLREGPISSYLPDINSPVDAAYDVPDKGVAYIFTGRVLGLVSMTRLGFQQENTVLHPITDPQSLAVFVVCCWIL